MGEYPTLSLGAARKRRDEIIQMLADGIDPNHVLQEKVEAQLRLVGPALDDYLARMKAQNRPKTHYEKSRVLGNGLAGWSKRPVNAIGKADIMKLVDAHEDRPALCRNLFSYVSHFLGWCVDRELLEANPCSLVKAPKPGKPKERALTSEEVAALMHVKGSTWGTMLKIALLTAQRGNEVCKMRLSEISVDNATWSIPDITMKQDRPHLVPLSKDALALIRGEIEARQKLVEGRPAWGEYIFGIGSHGKKPYDGRSNGMKQVLRLTGTSAWSGHDTRRTATTLMQKLGIPREVRTTVTGHAKPRDGAAHYETYDFEVEARAAVEKLAERVALIARGGAEVITLPLARGGVA